MMSFKKALKNYRALLSLIIFPVPVDGWGCEGATILEIYIRKSSECGVIEASWL